MEQASVSQLSGCMQRRNADLETRQIIQIAYHFTLTERRTSIPRTENRPTAAANQIVGIAEGCPQFSNILEHGTRTKEGKEGREKHRPGHILYTVHKGLGRKSRHVVTGSQGPEKRQIRRGKINSAPASCVCNPHWRWAIKSVRTITGENERESIAHGTIRSARYVIIGSHSVL